MKQLSGKRVALITENRFEEVELTSPKKAMEEAGMHVDIISTEKNDKVRAWNHDRWSIELTVNVKIENVKMEDYDMLVIPGGVINPDKMRVNHYFVDFAKSFLESCKPVTAICHGPQLLIETGLLDGTTSKWYFPPTQPFLYQARQ